MVAEATITIFRTNDDRVCAHYGRIEARLRGEEGIGRMLMVRARTAHDAYCQKLIQLADLTRVDAFCLDFEGRAAEIVGELQVNHHRFLSEIEKSIEPALTNESLRQQESAWRVEFAHWPASRALGYIEKQLGWRIGLNADKTAIVSDAELPAKVKVLIGLHREEIIELLQARQRTAGFQY